MASDPLFVPGRRVPAADLNALSPDPVAYVPVWANVTLGSGVTNQGWWWQIGREVNWVVELILGTGGDVTGTIEMDYPSNGGGAPACDASMATAFVGLFWASLGASTRHVGSGVGDVDGITRIAGSGTATGWNASDPFNWVASSALRGQGRYIAA